MVTERMLGLRYGGDKGAVRLAPGPKPWRDSWGGSDSHDPQGTVSPSMINICGLCQHCVHCLSYPQRTRVSPAGFPVAALWLAEPTRDSASSEGIGLGFTDLAPALALGSHQLVEH